MHALVRNDYAVLLLVQSGFLEGAGGVVFSFTSGPGTK